MSSTDSLLGPIAENATLNVKELQQPHVVLPADVLIDLKRTPPPAAILQTRRRRSREDRRRIEARNEWRQHLRLIGMGCMCGALLAATILFFNVFPAVDRLIGSLERLAYAAPAEDSSSPPAQAMASGAVGAVAAVGAVGLPPAAAPGYAPVQLRQLPLQ